MYDPTKTGKYAVPTYRNTGFLPWWKMLNDELAKICLPEVGYKAARDSYELGQSPDTAAADLREVWESELPYPVPRFI